MSEYEKKIRSMFEITCKSCGSDNVDIDFDAGDGCCPSPAMGWLNFECQGCGALVEIHDDE